MVLAKKSYNRLSKVTYTKVLEDNTYSFPSVVKCPRCTALLSLKEETVEAKSSELLHCLRCDHYFYEKEKEKASKTSGQQLNLDFETEQENNYLPNLRQVKNFSWQKNYVATFTIINSLVIVLLLLAGWSMPKLVLNLAYPAHQKLSADDIYITDSNYEISDVNGQLITTLSGTLNNQSEKKLKAVSFDLVEASTNAEKQAVSLIGRNSSEQIIFENNLPLKPGENTKFKIIRQANLNNDIGFYAVRTHSIK